MSCFFSDKKNLELIDIQFIHHVSPKKKSIQSHFTFLKLEPANFWNVCLKNGYNEQSIIKIVTDYVPVDQILNLQFLK